MSHHHLPDLRELCDAVAARAGETVGGFAGSALRGQAELARSFRVDHWAAPARGAHAKRDADRVLSLVLQSSAGAITTDIDFESIIQGQPGTQNINTVALPDEGELSEGDTLELTLTGLPGAGEVNLSQTLDAGETRLDAAQSLVADIATLTGSEGEPLGLSGEIVTVTTGVWHGGSRGYGHTDYVTVWL